MKTENGLPKIQRYDYIGIQSFKCEGCGQRFSSDKMYKTNYRTDNSDVLNMRGTELRNHVCSKLCANKASQWKIAHNQTLKYLLEKW